MSSFIITTVVSLMLGVLTGYYFERRASKEIRNRGLMLEEKLRVLRESIYAIGRGDSDHKLQDGKVLPDLEDEVGKWLKSYQGPDGTIPRARVIQKFLEGGFTGAQINAALVQLDERGVIAFGDVIEVL